MPSIAANLQGWNVEYDWRGAGHEWSEQFGGTEAEWWFAIYPRVHRFLPAGRILEIAPGFGRWTQFLKNHCESLVGVDLSAKCISHCKEQFSADGHLEFYVNDGFSLEVIPEKSIDFVFSFDSLVHAEKDVLDAYLEQLAKKLSPSGVGFIHHSNIGMYPVRLSMLAYYSRLPSIFRRHLLRARHVETLLSINASSWRGQTVTAASFRESCKRTGLKCIGQEVFSWHHGKCFTDAISIFAKPESEWASKDTYIENKDFIRSAVNTSQLAGVYCE